MEVKVKTPIALFLMVFFPLLAAAQPPDTLWTRTFGGNSDEYGFSVEQTLEGGYIVAGTTYSFGAGNSDIYLVKTDASGIQTWQHTFGGSGTELGYSVQQTTDGGYVIAGCTFSFGFGAPNVYLIKTDADGNQTWQRTFGSDFNEYGYSVQQTSDGGYIITGYTSSFGMGGWDVYLIKTHTNGLFFWQSTFGGSGDDYGRSVQQTTDGGYIIAGVTNYYGTGGSDVYLIKTDADGNQIWQRTFGGSLDDYGCGVQQTADGGYVIAGYTESYGAGAYDVYLIKTDANGNQIWQRTFGGSHTDYGYSVQQTADGGYVIAGYSTSYGAGDNDAYLIKTDVNGNLTWQQTIGGDSADLGLSVQQTSDGGYIITGYTESYGAGNSDVYLIKTESDFGSPNVTIALVPLILPIQIPATGGSFIYNASVVNNGASPATFDAWIMVQLPNLSWYGPVFGPLDLTLPAGVTVSRVRTQNVPASAPAGTYVYRGYVGHYANTKWDSAGFTFTKLTEGDGPVVGDWENYGQSFEPFLTLVSAAPVPDIYALEQNYPNPFNSLTAIRYQIPDVRYVSLRVYNTAGRLVADLVEAHQDAGEYMVTFDAGALASSIYLYRLEAGGFTATQKMVLMK